MRVDSSLERGKLTCPRGKSVRGFLSEALFRDAKKGWQRQIQKGSSAHDSLSYRGGPGRGEGD